MTKELKTNMISAASKRFYLKKMQFLLLWSVPGSLVQRVGTALIAK